MGLNVRLEKLTADEVRQLACWAVTSAEGLRIRRRAGEVWVRQAGPVQRGRWEPLVWFSRSERIMSTAELTEALQRHT